jgi:RHS repeat-associated protein
MKDDQSGTYYFTVDHLGSTRELTDESGEVAERVEYDSYGNGSSSLTRYGYTGRESDEQTGLYYYRARWYDASIGRFISEDPVGFNGGINFYAYVKNNPLNLIDPEGTQFRPDRDRPGDQYPGMKKPYQPDRSGGAACALDGFNPWLSLEGGGGFQLINFIGGYGSIGVIVNPLTGELCVYTKVCESAGTAIGLYAGAGLQGGLAAGSAEGKKTGGPSIEGFIDEAEGLGIGGTAGYGGGFNGSASIKGYGGAGWAFGFRPCYTKILYCINSAECSCSK